MRLIHDAKGVSKLFFILLLLVSFIVGALLSYIWTMGYYAPLEFHLPSRTNITIENVDFSSVENVTFFNVAILHPSYSPSTNVEIKRIMVSTSNGSLYTTIDTDPQLPQQLARGSSLTVRSFWNWTNYTGQTANVIVLVADGSGATFEASIP